jgi:hypothetical protein
MSTKKETERSTTVYDDKREVRTGLLEQNHAVDRALDETRNNITKTIDEARKEIPRNTHAINDYQEHTLQASKEIVAILNLKRRLSNHFSQHGFRILRIRMAHFGIIGHLHEGIHFK